MDCGRSHRYGADGRFVATAAGPSVRPPRFPTPGDWNLWQVDELALRMTAARRATAAADEAGDAAGGPGNRKPLFADQGVRLLTGYRSARVRRRDVGTLILNTNGLALAGERQWLFPFGEIEGVNVQNTEVLEFYHHGTLFRFEQPSPRSNAYKWLKAVQFGREILIPAVPQSGP